MKTIIRKTLLYKTGVEYGDFTINHVQGCSHGCTYPCYALQMAKRFGKVKSYDEWRDPKLVINALDLLEQELPALKHRIGSVHLCFTTDPFMNNQPEVADLSLKIIEKLNRNDIKVTTLTKGTYPEEISRNGFSPFNEYGISLVCLDEAYRKEYEPFSATYEQRLESLKRLKQDGCKTWVSIEPYPTPNIIHQSLSKLLNSLKFVDRIIFGRLNYSAKVSEYKYARGFYNKCSREVLEFCLGKGTDCHIKTGTDTRPKTF